MKKYIYISLAAFTLACSTKQEPAVPEAAAENQASKTETPVTEEKSMSSIPDFQLHTLSNGLEVYLIPKSDIPMVTILLAVKNGAYVQTPDIEGLAHLYEHMFFKANEKIPNQAQYMAELDQLGVELGPNMNAATSTESVRYYYTVQSRFLDRGIEFLSDATVSPKFLTDELEKEREVVIAEFDRFEASPLQVFYQQDLLYRLFKDQFPRKNTIGNRKIILAASHDQMKYIQQRFYIPNNSALFLVGDFDPKEAIKSIERHYGRWEAGPDPFTENPIPEHTPLANTEVFEKKAAVQTANIIQTYQGPKLGLENKESIALDLVSLMLSLESSPFQKELVHSGIASSAYLYVWSQRYTSPLFFGVETSPEKAQIAYEKMSGLIQKLSAGGFFSESDLRLAKASIETRSAFDREVGQRYALALASIWTSTGSLDFYTNYVPMMNQVQMSDIDAALKKYIHQKHFVLGALLPEGSADMNFGAPAAKEVNQ